MCQEKAQTRTRPPVLAGTWETTLGSGVTEATVSDVRQSLYGGAEHKEVGPPEELPSCVCLIATVRL